MGCGISTYIRRQDGGGYSESKPRETQHGFINSQDDQGAREKDRSSRSPSWRLGEEVPKVINECRLEDISNRRKHDDDDDEDKLLCEEGNGSVIYYPRSPSFRDYCTDSELYHDIPDHADSDTDGNESSRKIVSKSTMSSPNRNNKGDVAAAKTESKGRSSTSSLSGLRMWNVLSGGDQNNNNNWKRKRLRSYLKLSTWHTLYNNTTATKTSTN